MARLTLICPKDRSRLSPASDGSLRCERGHAYPVVEGVPVLLRDDVAQTMKLAGRSLARARGDVDVIDARSPDLFLESLGISEAEKTLAAELGRSGGSTIDPVASVIIGATSGHAYRHLIGRLDTYPIPDLPLPDGNGKTLLDIGCNWGRWSIAAARKGYRVVGIDPSLGAVMAANRIARQLGLEIDYVVGDGRYLPFEDMTFDVVFSYSVIQHFNKTDALRTIDEVGRVLNKSGRSLIQMAHWFGLRSLYHQSRRRFREAAAFEVRYWTIREMHDAFASRIGATTIGPHCYFGLGLEASDADLMPKHLKLLLRCSDGLRRLGTRWPFLTRVADSVYVSSRRGEDAGAR